MSGERGSSEDLAQEQLAERQPVEEGRSPKGEANQRAGRALVQRVARESTCMVRLPVDEEPKSAPRGETEVQVSDGTTVQICSGTYDASTRSLSVRIDDALAKSLFSQSQDGPRQPSLPVAEPSRPKGIAFAEGLRIGSGGITYTPDDTTKISVRPKGDGWRVTVKRTF